MDPPIDLPDEWRDAGEVLEKEGGKAIILGPTSSGKTTFLKYAVGRLSKSNRRVALVDADIGQSTLGPPATIGGTILEPGVQQVEKIEARYLYFVGTTSPSQALLRCVAGVKRLADWAGSFEPFATLCDTTGMVQGIIALMLKFHKIDLLQPRHLFALQNRGEVEPILRHFNHHKGLIIHRLPVAPSARIRSAEDRRVYRSGRYRAYFKGARMQVLAAQGIDWLNATTQPISLEDRSFPRHLLVALNDADQQTLALGIVSVFDREAQELFIYTPLTNLSAVRYLVAGSLRVDLAGRELS